MPTPIKRDTVAPELGGDGPCIPPLPKFSESALLALRFSEKQSLSRCGA
jgi:hypothetical protein